MKKEKFYDTCMVFLCSLCTNITVLQKQIVLINANSK